MKGIKKVFKQEIKDFFYKNKGKLFCIFMAISIVIAIIDPITDKVINVVKLKHPYADSQVQLVDVSINEYMLIPEIDIKLRNTGEAVALISRVEIIMKDYTILDNLYGKSKDNALNNVVEYTGLYNIMLSNKESQSFKLSQKIYGNDVDRFIFRIVTSEEAEYYSTICTFKIRLYYNEDNKYIESDFMTIVTDYKSSFYYKEYSNFADKKISNQNFNKLSRINKYQSKKSDEFKKLYNSYKYNKTHYLDE